MYVGLERRPVALAQQDLDLVRSLLERNGITIAHGPVIFGSRATGTARRYSDLDLGFSQKPATPAQLRQIREDLDESSQKRQPSPKACATPRGFWIECWPRQRTTFGARPPSRRSSSPTS